MIPLPNIVKYRFHCFCWRLAYLLISYTSILRSEVKSRSFVLCRYLSLLAILELRPRHYPSQRSPTTSLIVNANTAEIAFKCHVPGFNDRRVCNANIVCALLRPSSQYNRQFVTLCSPVSIFPLGLIVIGNGIGVWSWLPSRRFLSGVWVVWSTVHTLLWDSFSSVTMLLGTEKFSVLWSLSLLVVLAVTGQVLVTTLLLPMLPSRPKCEIWNYLRRNNARWRFWSRDIMEVSQLVLHNNRTWKAFEISTIHMTTLASN